MYKMAVIPGDGTGPEVVAEGLKVLEAAAEKFGFKYETTTFDLGGERYLKTGETLSSDDLERLRTEMDLSPSELQTVKIQYEEQLAGEHP